MTAYTRNASGTWAETTKWTPNGTPVTGDTVAVTTYAVQVSADIAFKSVYVHTGGTLTVDAGVDMIMDDHADAYLLVASTGTIAVNGTYASPVTLSPPSSPPTNKLDVRICSTTSTIAHFHISDVQVAIGKTGTDYIGVTRTPRIGNLQRSPRIDSDPCLGRYRGRVHYKGNESGILDVEGTWRVSELQWEYVDEMKEAGTTGFFVSQYVQMPNCKILSHEIAPSDTDYRKYTLTLIEDE